MPRCSTSGVSVRWRSLPTTARSPWHRRSMHASRRCSARDAGHAPAKAVQEFRQNVMAITAVIPVQRDTAVVTASQFKSRENIMTRDTELQELAAEEIERVAGGLSVQEGLKLVGEILSNIS